MCVTQIPGSVLQVNNIIVVLQSVINYDYDYDYKTGNAIIMHQRTCDISTRSRKRCKERQSLSEEYNCFNGICQL